MNVLFLKNKSPMEGNIIMSTVNDIVRQSILAYPVLFGSRTEVLHHVLCVLGAGYVWDENGEIVSTTGVSEHWTPEREDAAWAENATFNPGRFVLKVFADLCEDNKKIASERVANVDTLMHKVEAIDEMYPQSDMVPLMNVPGNATKEWLIACSEMREIATAAKIDAWVM